jgi:hypothetical protein
MLCVERLKLLQGSIHAVLSWRVERLVALA